MEVGRRVSREMSVEKEKICVEAKMMRPTFKKVQIVYYLARNGHLEHPHYMEVTHLAHQHLRLKDVLDRLIVLRGKGMPALYSWSCKRSYKNGYVWNDLAENDVIYPSEGAEYVLKGSELIEGCTDKLHHLQVGNVHVHQESSLVKAKRKPLVASKQPYEAEEMANNNRYNHGREEEEEEEYEEKTSYTTTTAATTPRSRRSRGVSTDEIEEFKQPTSSFPSPPSTASSEKANSDEKSGGVSKRFEDGVINEALVGRNSMLLSLIACGGSASFRKAAPPPRNEEGRKSGGLHRDRAAEKVVDEEEAVMICTMSENPRINGREEKEYFSGSIMEEAAMDRVDQGLKKSSSHNQERSAVAGLGGAVEEEEGEEVQKKKGVKGKCMPMKKSSYKLPKK